MSIKGTLPEGILPYLQDALCVSAMIHSSELRHRQMAGLPGDDFVKKLLLLSAGAGQIDAGGLNASVAHQIRQKGNVIKLCQEIFGEPMAEGMGIYGFRINAVL